MTFCEELKRSWKGTQIGTIFYILAIETCKLWHITKIAGYYYVKKLISK